MLALIAAIALIPFLLARYYAQHPQLIAKRSNYGTLITPAQPLAYEDLLASSGLQQAKGRWIRLQILPSGAACGAACRETSHTTRQIHLLLNKDIVRVRRLILSGNPDFVQGGGDKDDPDLLRGLATPVLSETLTQVLGRPLEEGMLILIDPFANAMMWYPPGFDPYGVLRDIKHLLRASQIG